MGNQTPFRPDELMAPPMQGTAFVHFLRREKTRKYPAAPPFIQALCRGELTMDQVWMWVKDLYPYWGDGLAYATGAIYIKTNDEPLRTHMLRRMVDVEGKDTVADLTDWTTPAYEELWFRFGEGIGLSRGEVLEWPQFTRTFFSMRTLMTYSRYWDWTWLDGIATWYAADLYWREHYGAARQALSTKYGIADRGAGVLRRAAGGRQLPRFVGGGGFGLLGVHDRAPADRSPRLPRTFGHRISTAVGVERGAHIRAAAVPDACLGLRLRASG